ncbi:porin [Roseibium polysiphoniae]|uniref:Porin n=1 Tax=Roseibium polysiphoniae TaxID=2571221 RepID=A0ABR9C577_9HYPH|nr:porin [Roseibium polysiphoniae]MBD8875043.1 porin [Roseibium polysiphoniae]
MNFKSLMLGAAAAAAATGAQAADLPVAPEPVDYVRVCDAYGARFYYIPGTETCLRVGGRVRANYVANNFADDGTWGGRDEALDFNAEGYLYLDARTNTEFGLLRAFIEYEIESDDDAKLGKAYIQWGGLTFGHATSFFDFFTGQANQGVVTRNWSDVTTDLAAYTAAFGNGFSATLSVEDGTFREVGDYAGHKIPDFVANLRVDQGWGSAQIMAALHNVRPASASDDGALGWAIGGGVIIDLPMLASGSNIAFQAQYADGALAYIGSSDSYNGQSVYDAAPNGDTSTGYSLSAGVYHQATSTVGLALDGSYMDVDLGNSTTDVTRWAIDGSVAWTPVSGLTLGVDMGYANTDVDGAGDQDEILAGFRVQRTF